MKLTEQQKIIENNDLTCSNCASDVELCECTTLLLGNFTFHHFTEEELKLFKTDSEQRALIHELEEVKVFDNKKDAYDEADNTHHQSWIIPSEFKGEIVFDSQLIRCNMCWWHGTEDALTTFTDLSEREVGYEKGCPNCKTDNYLIDIDYETTTFTS